ncbi:MAG: undecaprenyl/decaprenyl-phosphate alpha-N-acetylglucosaminyl 1-phosphate transferase [Treponema sp.]|nr:undecaprenyl/decaprenyl-phosphate alpha-N-acetylglucosaminyl 1-phosphate transferase [Treponema sp.]
MTGGIIIFLAVAVASGTIVALLIRLAHSRSWYDRVSERRVHSGKVPRLGGLGFVPVFVVTATVIMSLSGQPYTFARFLPVLVGVCVIAIFGVWDDFRPLRPLVKLLVQVGAALCVAIPGYVFRRIVFFDEGLLAQFPWIGFAVTVLWLVGMTNAVNLIDGVDALAGGISLLVALTFAYVFSRYAGLSSSVMICIALAGAIAGFLVFNAPVPRAKIFMGDGGSQFLGFTLALLPLLEERHTMATLPMLYVAAILAIPIFDTTAAVWRRVRDRKPLSSPDRAHIHHKLMNLGLSAPKIGAVLFGLQAIVSVVVIVSLKIAPARGSSLAVLGLAYAVVIVFFTALHFMNKKRMACTGEAPPPPLAK